MKPQDTQRLVVDEPVVTGQVQIQYKGNKAMAASHARASLKMLGQLRTRYGVNQTVAQGIAPGYFKDAQYLADGTLVEVMSNNGQDLIRITTPEPVPVPTNIIPPSPRTPVPEPEPEDSQGPPPEPIEPKSIPEPPPRPKKPEEEQKKKKREEEEDPYLWIGLRPVQPLGLEDTPYWYAGTVGGCLIEPDGVFTLLGEGSVFDRGMRYMEAADINDPASFNYTELADYRSYVGAPLTVATISDYNANIARGVGFEPLFVGYDTIGGVAFSSSGVMGYCLQQNSYFLEADAATAQSTLAPVDWSVPMTDEMYPDGQGGPAHGSSTWAGNFHWHNVFELDPDDSIPVSTDGPKRDNDLKVRETVKHTIDTLYGNTIDTKGGVYVLLVQIFGWCCFSKGGTPVDVEIEVRLGKNSEVVFKTTVQVAWWTQFQRPVLPWGARQSSSFAYPEFGSPNPNAENWWQGALLIDVESMTVSQVNTLAQAQPYLPAGMFVQDEWDKTLDTCTSLWPAWLYASFYPGTTPIGDTLTVQAWYFARTYWYHTWYGGDQGWIYGGVDFSVYEPKITNLANQIIAYANSVGRSNLNGTKIICSGEPADQGTQAAPAITITEMSTTTSTEWTNLVNGGQIYNGAWHHMRAVF